MCELLLLYGADVHLRTSQFWWSAGLFAAQRGHPQLWRLLREAGVDLTQCNSSREGARAVAATWAKRSCVEMIDAEEEYRRLARESVVERLGEHQRLQRDSVALCLQYAGLEG